MKKILPLILALALVLTLAACGSGGGGKPDTPVSSDSIDSAGNSAPSTLPNTTETSSSEEDGIGTRLEDISVDNWQETVKAFAGIDVALPTGWAIASADGGTTTVLKFEGADTASFDSFVETVFEATRIVAYTPPYSIMGNHPYDAYTDAMTADTNLEKTYQWMYDLSDDFMDIRNIKLRLADGVCEWTLM